MKKTKSLDKFIFILFLFCLTGLVFIFYLLLSLNDHFSPVELMLSQSNEKPIVYRVLPAMAANFISLLTGIPLSVSAILVMFFSLLGFLRVYDLLVRAFLPGINPYFSLILCAILLVPFLFQNRYIYDFPILFLFSMAIYLLSKNKYGCYLILLICASLTKETSLFLIFYTILNFRKFPKKKYFLMIFVQLVIYSIIRLALMVIFYKNPGSVVQYHLLDHIRIYIDKPIGALVLFTCLTGLFIFGITDKSENQVLYKNSFLAIGCPILILYLFFGYPFEIRVFLEIFPIISLLLTSKLEFVKILIHPIFSNQVGNTK